MYGSLSSTERIYEMAKSSDNANEGQEIPFARVQQGIGGMTRKVRIAEGASIAHDEKPYVEGDEVELPLPIAENLIIMGQAEYVED